MITLITIITMITARQLRRAKRKLRQLTLTGYSHRHRHHCHCNRHCHRHRHRNIICHHCNLHPECTDTDGSMTQEWGQTAGRLQRIQEVAATLLGISLPNKVTTIRCSIPQPTTLLRPSKMAFISNQFPYQIRRLSGVCTSV